ncbi:Alpha/Beta hydrolase protein [Piptocephalis cylindrospora]|uniref:Alpha/Beta hydrolase protein n=1 Tax=Piptocephalis cylindrospora TaxID=1907219 RepID=A0A4P9Y1G2_9FUNG|nr:Alpha/Beta hydrolase protein [Piptocephalis cylindrospora]|eukprot:RKP12504.1 Alpha/Beta hydrolase protein [Piptocephalis cylindrospora]
MHPVPLKVDPVSIKHLQVAGLLVSIIGMEELQQDCKRPTTVLFLLHGRIGSSADMDPIGHRLIRESLKHPDRSRDLLIINLDLPNHGSRCVNPRRNNTLATGNQSHSEDMWLQIRQATRDVSFLIDTLPLIPDWPSGRVDLTWGTYGFSMGAHIGFICASLEPRISLFVSIHGTPNLAILGEIRAKEYKAYFSEQLFQDMVKHGALGNMDRLRQVDILSLHADNDTLVPWSISESVLHDLSTSGRTSYKVYSGIGHVPTEEVLSDSFDWVMKRLK